MITITTKKVWTKPSFDRLGQIGDVALTTSLACQSPGPGNGCPPSSES